MAIQFLRLNSQRLRSMQKPSEDNSDRSLEEMTLEELFELKDIAVFELLTIPGIHKRLKSNLKLFAQYLKMHQQFFMDMINVGIKIPIHEGSDERMKQVIHIASDILLSGSNHIIGLFVIAPDQKSDEVVYETITCNQATGEVEVEQKTLDSQSTNQFENKYRFLIELMKYLQNGQINEVCLSYLISVLNLVIDKDSIAVFEFFKGKGNYLDHLIQLSYQSSVSAMLAKLLAFEDPQSQNREVKKYVFDSVGDFMRKSIKDSSRFEGYLDFFTQILQVGSKVDVEEGMDDVKEIADGVVSAQTIKFYVQVILSMDDQNILSNAILYLNKIVKKQADQQEGDEQYEKYYPKKESLVKYQLELAYRSIQKLILGQSAKIMKYRSNLRMSFLQLLSQMTRHPRFSQFAQKQFNIVEILTTLLKLFDVEKSNGLVKFHIQNLIQKFLKVKNLQEDDLQKLLSILRNSSLYKKYRENSYTKAQAEGMSFLVKILMIFQNKLEQTEVQSKSNKNETLSDLNLDKIRENFSAKLSDLSPTKHRTKHFGFAMVKFVKLQEKKDESTKSDSMDESSDSGNQTSGENTEQVLSPGKRELNLAALNGKLSFIKKRSMEAKLTPLEIDHKMAKSQSHQQKKEQENKNPKPILNSIDEQGKDEDFSPTIYKKQTQVRDEYQKEERMMEQLGEDIIQEKKIQQGEISLFKRPQKSQPNTKQQSKEVIKDEKGAGVEQIHSEC